MRKNTIFNTGKTVTCPRCHEVFKWRYRKAPSLGWVCKYCREELNISNGYSRFCTRPTNDLQERRLDEE
jgi:transposase-like protein